MYEDFGERLRKLRINAGLTQAKLGKRINRGVTTISKYESGAILPTMEIAVELAFELRVSLDELFGYENTSVVSTFGLSDEQKELVSSLIALFRGQSNSGKQRLTAEQCEVIGRIMEAFYNK
ncbi:MAG: helix-turn-helix domain-containing protein [Oscillospiraceae bacterium]|nr:helix-turn-helix domain-containing protein [Oscillospiraceae bacterium]